MDRTDATWSESEYPDRSGSDSGLTSLGGRPNWAPDTPWFEQAEFVEKDLLPMGSSLNLIYVTGGEPLFTPAFETMLEEYVRRGHAKNIRIGINSNLFHNEGRISRAVESMLKFSSCNIGASIDGYGEVYEYIRYPARWNIVERNIRALKSTADQNPHFSFLVTTVAQAYNILNLVDLWHFADDLSIECNPHVLEGPLFLKPHVLPRTQDHMVTPGPALRMAKLLKAQVLELTGDCGHVVTSCEMGLMAPVVRNFLSK